MGIAGGCLARDSCGWQAPIDDDLFADVKRSHVDADQLRHRLAAWSAGKDRDGELVRLVSGQDLPVGGEQTLTSPDCSPSAWASPASINTLVEAGCGPWGIPSARGGDTNAWDDIDATTYMVRSATYLSSRKKVPSGPSLCELLVYDMFLCDRDIVHISTCEGAKTVQRLRRAGETRQLFVLNIRVRPLHGVAVWAVPDAASGGSQPARSLLQRFMTDMPDEERHRRLKGIIRVIGGPWMVRRMAPENKPFIIGKEIKVKYLKTAKELEASVSIASSASFQRFANALLGASKSLALEVVLVVEGQREDELPEQVLGGFRNAHADLRNLRIISPGSPHEEKKAHQRPSFLPEC